MRFKLTKFNLRLASAIMLLIAIAAVSFSLSLPAQPLALSTAITVQSPATAPASTQAAESLDLFSEVMDVELRRPLVDPPTTAGSSTSVNADATLKLRLTGTIIEPMHSYAVFTDASGKSEIKSVGDKLGGADIAEITQDSVTLRFPGRSMILHSVKPPGIGGLGL